MTNASYVSYARQQAVRAWEHSSEQEPHPWVVRGALVIRSNVDLKLRQNIVVTDAKALYDALDRDCLKAQQNRSP